MTDLCVDTSALLKRVFIEPESSQVRTILGARAATGDLLVSSEVAWVEVTRSVSRAAIHLAAAISVGASEILTFDRRLAQAAEQLGVRAIP